MNPIGRLLGVAAVLLWWSVPCNAAVVYPVDDFDDAAAPNDFYADQGVWFFGGAQVTASFDTSEFFGAQGASWRIDYAVPQPGDEGGIWEYFTHNYLDAANPSYDLSRFEAFRFRVKGGRTLSPPGDHFTTRFLIEFVDLNWNKSVHEVTGITGAWKDYIIPLTGAIDWTRVRQVGLVLRHGQVDDTQGTLYLDDLQLVDADAGYTTDDEFLNLLSEAHFRYFWDTSHPVTGLTRDRALERSWNAISAVGFQLTAIGIGASRGWVSRQQAADRVKRILTTLWEGPQGPGTTGVTGYKGFFYHFLDIETGLRTFDSELSSIDSTLCLAGVLFVREYFNGPDPVEAQIRALADQIYRRVDWTFFYDPATRLFTQAWLPESGYVTWKWDDYTDEAILVGLLAIGSPTFPVPVESFYAWTRGEGSYGGHTLVRSWSGAMFHYQFAHNWFDLRGRWDRHPTTPVNWFDNAKQAALANRQFCIDNSSTYVTYGPNSWGLTAGGTQDGYKFDTGAEPLGVPPARHDGTINPYGAGSMITMTPAESIAALKNYYENVPKLWEWFGLRDAYDLQSTSDPSDDWHGHDHLGIDDGPTLVAIENYRTGLVWTTFMRNPHVQAAITSVFTTTPPPPPAVIFDNFEGTNINDGWLEGVKGTFKVIDPANTERVHGGAKALKAMYDKGGQRYAFLYSTVSDGSRDFSSRTALRAWIYPTKCTTYTLRIEYQGGSTFIDRRFSVARGVWQELVLDISARRAEMTNVSRLVVLPEPGVRRTKGTFWLDDIRLE